MDSPIFRKTLAIDSTIHSALFWPNDEIKKNRVQWQKQALLYFMTDQQVRTIMLCIVIILTMV